MTDDPHGLHRILLIDPADGRVDAELIDNVHQFRVTIRHDGERVTDVDAHADRFPWTSCPAGLDRLKALTGTPVRDGAGGAPAVDKSRQCTHLFDLAKLAVAHALDGRALRYDVRVRAAGEGDGAEAKIRRDGRPVLQWTVRDRQVVSPGPFDGHRTDGRATWPDAVRGDAALVEAAILLRRALLVFFGRRRSKGTLRATQLPYMSGACLTFQPGVAETAVRPAGFTDHPVGRVARLPSAWPSPFER